MHTLYLHIGTPKTATTSIQMFCEDNPKALAAQGYCYPILNFKYPKIEKRRNGHFLVGRIQNKEGKTDKERQKKMFDEGMKLIHDSFEQYDNVILSDEGLWNCSTGKQFSFWNTLAEDARAHQYQVKVVVYLRRQDEFANSWLAQQVKEGWTVYRDIKWDDFRENPFGLILDYYDILSRIGEVVGTENIIVRIFEPKRFAGRDHSIYSDFLEAVGVEYTDDFQVITEENNPSLTGNSQELRRIMNTILPIDGKERAYIRAVAEQIEQTKSKGNKFIMTSEADVKKFMKKYDKGNKLVAQEFLHSKEPLFHVDTQDGVVWSTDNEYMLEDVVRFFGTIYLNQAEQIKELQAEVKRFQDSRKEAMEAAGDEIDKEMLAKVLEMDKEIHSIGKEQLAHTGRLNRVESSVNGLRKANKSVKQTLKKYIKDKIFQFTKTQ